MVTNFFLGFRRSHQFFLQRKLFFKVLSNCLRGIQYDFHIQIKTSYYQKQDFIVWLFLNMSSLLFIWKFICFFVFFLMIVLEEFLILDSENIYTVSKTVVSIKREIINRSVIMLIIFSFYVTQIFQFESNFFLS